MVRNDQLALSRALQAEIPTEWPEFPQAFAAQNFSANRATRWGGFLFVDDARASLVGNGGFKGPPNDAGAVEIGYEIAPVHRRRGYATRATQLLVQHAFEEPRVRSIVAHTLVSGKASIAVLVKNGFIVQHEIVSESLGPILRLERRR